MALLEHITKLPTLGNVHRIPKTSTPVERTSHSENFANALKTLAPHINVMDLEHGKTAIEDAAKFCLEKSPAFLFRVRVNLQNINTKLNLQKYVYNSILRGEKLYVM